MKRFLSAILAIIMILVSLASCSGNTIVNSDDVTTEVIDQTSISETSSVIETASEPETDEPEVISEISYQDIVTAIVDSGKTPVITHIPSFDGNKVSAVVDISLAINAKTQYPEAALRFLQYAGSFEYMIDDIRYYDCKSISVNKQYIEAEKAAYYGYDIDLPSDYNVAYFYKRFSPLPIEIIDTYYSMLDNIYVPEYASMRAVTHLVDSMIYYEKQNCDFEKFVSEMERRLSNYFAE